MEKLFALLPKSTADAIRSLPPTQQMEYVAHALKEQNEAKDLQLEAKDLQLEAKDLQLEDQKRQSEQWKKVSERKGSTAIQSGECALSVISLIATVLTISPSNTHYTENLRRGASRRHPKQILR